MERYFYRRGERIPVTEVDGVVAVRVADDARGSVDVATFGEPVAGARAMRPALELNDQEAQALAAAGWVFVRPAREISAARASGALPSQVNDVNTVYQQPDGHVLIGTRTLTVQFNPELAESEARAPGAAGFESGARAPVRSKPVRSAAGARR